MVPDFNSLLQKYAAESALDWKLIYYQCKQESNGDPDSVSPTGAVGLMQLEPYSFPLLTQAQLRDPETNIKTGVRFLADMIGTFEREQEPEKTKFGLAAYNAGVGNVVRAQEAAHDAGYPSDIWVPVGAALAQITGVSNALQTTWYVHIITSNWALNPDGI